MTGLSVRDLLNNVCLCGLFAGLWFLELVKDGFLDFFAYKRDYAPGIECVSIVM